MNNDEINGKIAVKQKEISVEQNPNKKAELQKDLQVLNLRMQIISFQNRIEQIRNGMR